MELVAITSHYCAARWNDIDITPWYLYVLFKVKLINTLI